MSIAVPTGDGESSRRVARRHWCSSLRFAPGKMPGAAGRFRFHQRAASALRRVGHLLLSARTHFARTLPMTVIDRLYSLEIEFHRLSRSEAINPMERGPSTPATPCRAATSRSCGRWGPSIPPSWPERKIGWPEPSTRVTSRRRSSLCGDSSSSIEVTGRAASPGCGSRPRVHRRPSADYLLTSPFSAPHSDGSRHARLLAQLVAERGFRLRSPRLLLSLRAGSQRSSRRP